MSTKSLKMISFEGEFRALCEKHGCALQTNYDGEIAVCFHDKDTQVTDPLEDVTLVEDRL